ncbi:hypothetical protein H2199_007631 [Coniosporium tulheliwenetii]|uniref:Uncharacterized protein n=1 Tax=Coniosporium tulheliwenetii TaxID=3383036 RepID=A0ACC2YQB7_9PEZI|nr:hypothetical protein H2199_007631 [Cladosporium sp. JES 115]
MASKRKRDADLPSPPPTPSTHPAKAPPCQPLRLLLHLLRTARKALETQKPNPFPSTASRKKKHAIAPLKRRVRDLTRQLSRLEDLPADVRIAKERELQACEWDLRAEEAAVRRREMIGMYHMVRFFERQKATKRLKAARKALANAEKADGHGDEVERPHQDRQTLERAVRDAEVDLNYTLYYPLAEPYVSLWPKAPNRKTKRRMGEAEEAGDEDGVDRAADGQSDARAEAKTNQGPKGDPAMRALVEKAMQEGPAALDALKNDLPLQGTETRPDGAKPKARPLKRAAERSAGKAERVQGRDQGLDDEGKEDGVDTEIKAKRRKEPKLDVRKKTKIRGVEAKNRRERRAAMRRLEEEIAKEEEDSDGGFFESGR